LCDAGENNLFARSFESPLWCTCEALLSSFSKNQRQMIIFAVSITCGNSTFSICKSRKRHPNMSFIVDLMAHASLLKQKKPCLDLQSNFECKGTSFYFPDGAISDPHHCKLK